MHDLNDALKREGAAMRPGSDSDDRKSNERAHSVSPNQSLRITDQEIVEPILDMLNDLATDPAEFQAEQELIVWVLERYDGSAQLETIATEIGAEPHELAVPIDLLHQSEIVEVADIDDQMTVSLTSKR